MIYVNELECKVLEFNSGLTNFVQRVAADAFKAGAESVKPSISATPQPTPDDLWRDYEVSIIRHHEHKGWAVTRWRDGEWLHLSDLVDGGVWDVSIAMNALKFPTHAAAMEAAKHVVHGMAKVERTANTEPNAKPAQPVKKLTLSDMDPAAVVRLVEAGTRFSVAQRQMLGNWAEYENNPDARNVLWRELHKQGQFFFEAITALKGAK